MSRKKKTPTKINPNTLKIRDPLIQKLIGGATKAGVQKDKKKEANKKTCRENVDPVCNQCGSPFSDGINSDNHDGFCSERCMEIYNELCYSDEDST